MDGLLETTWKVWITVGPLVLVGTFFIFGVFQDEWRPVILAFIVFCAGIMLMSDGGSGVLKILEKFAATYDKNKGTADILKIIESQPQNVIQVAVLTVYCLSKFFLKIVFYNMFVSLFREVLSVKDRESDFGIRVLNRLLCGYTVVALACILGICGIDPSLLIKNEGIISIVIFAMPVLYDTFKTVLSGYGKEKKWRSGTALILGSVVAFAYWLPIEARLWRFADKKFFSFILDI